MRPPVYRYISAADAQEHSNPADIRATLVRQLASPVRWTQTVRALLALAPTLIECGPGKVLSGLVRRIDRSASCYALEDPESVAAAVAATANEEVHVSGRDLALVTGGSRGIGRAIALALGGAGATVVATATTAEGAGKISADFRAAGIRGRGLVWQATEPAATDALVEALDGAEGLRRLSWSTTSPGFASVMR